MTSNKLIDSESNLYIILPTLSSKTSPVPIKNPYIAEIPRAFKLPGCRTEIKYIAIFLKKKQNQGRYEQYMFW